MQGMNKIKQMVVPGVLVLALLLAGCQTPPDGPTPAPSETATVEATPTEAPPTPTLEPPPLPTAEPVTEADLDASLDVARDFLARLSAGEYRVVYGSLLTTGGQQRLADLVLGRLALSNPHISFFELLGSQPADGRIAVDVVWRETFEGQGELGTQEATVFLARQGDQILVDDVVLGSFSPAATPVPPASAPRRGAEQPCCCRPGNALPGLRLPGWRDGAGLAGAGRWHAAGAAVWQGRQPGR